MVHVDPLVRLCFRDAAENGDEAEWVSIQGTMEGGTVIAVGAIATAVAVWRLQGLWLAGA